MMELRNDMILGTLTVIPPTDGNYQSGLKNATKEELEAALEIMRNRNGKDKARITACERELKKRDKLCSY